MNKLLKSLFGFFRHTKFNILEAICTIGFVVVEFLVPNSQEIIFGAIDDPIILKIEQKHYVIALISFYIISFIVRQFNEYKKSIKISELELDINNSKKKIEDLSKEKVELENQMESIYLNDKFLFDNYLALIFKGIGIDKKEQHNYRISVYKISDIKFLLLGRYSTNTRFNKPSPNRNEYKINEGFIGKAWEIGECFVENLPDPNENFNGYVNEIKKIVVNIDENSISKMRMRSRTYYIKRLSGHNDEPKAIIVFESLLPQVFKIELIESQFEQISKMLVSFIEKIEPVKYGNDLAQVENF